MPDAALTVEMLPLDDLHPDPRNPRNNTAAIEMIASSIRQFGFLVPLVVDADRKIIAGHARYLAARMLKLTDVPCVLADDLTPEQATGFSVAENRTSDFSFFDLVKLSEMAVDLPPEFVADFDLESLLSDLNPDEVAVPAVVRAGASCSPSSRRP